jgi:hypothetical protein
VSRSTTAPRSRPYARLALSALLFAMAAGQLSDVSGFVDIVAAYGIGGASAARLTAAVLIAGEVIAAGGLVSRGARGRHRAASVAVAVAVVWGSLGTQAFGRGIALDNCGCFGVHLAQPLRWWVLVQDLELLALAWWVRAGTARAVATDRSPAEEPEPTQAS